MAPQDDNGGMKKKGKSRGWTLCRKYFKKAKVVDVGTDPRLRSLNDPNNIINSSSMAKDDNGGMKKKGKSRGWTFCRKYFKKAKVVDVGTDPHLGSLNDPNNIINSSTPAQDDIGGMGKKRKSGCLTSSGNKIKKVKVVYDGTNPRLPSPKDPKSFGDFPFDDEGKWQEGHVHNYKEVQKSSTMYFDIHVPKAQTAVIYGDIRRLKVTFNYNLYNKYKSRIKSTESDSVHYPIEVDMDTQSFGIEFERAIGGMKKGGIRRIVFRESETGPEEKPSILDEVGDAILDVHLLEFENSWGGVIRNLFP